MNQADKDEALRLLNIADWSEPWSEAVLIDLRALIERQTDTDGEMWRFCVEHGFPVVGSGGACVTYKSIPFIGDTPTEAVRAAMTLVGEKA